MKKTLFPTILLLLVIITGCQSNKPLTPEQQAKADALAYKIENLDFEFKPRTMKPMSGRTFQLAGGYYLYLSPESVTAYLPYIGRAYVAPTNPRSIGVDFTSQKFEYSVTQKKPGKYSIEIKPQDLNNIEDRGIVFYISADTNGYATVSIQFTNRQTVSYYGVID